MKFIFFLITTLFFVSCKSTSIDRSIKFNLTNTSDYCGGAMPNEDLIDDLNTPKPFNGVIYIHKDPERKDKGIAQKFKNGKASISGLVNGEYLLFEHPAIDIEELEKNDKTENNQPQGIMESECKFMKNFQVLEVVSIDQETKDVSINIHLSCDPCNEPMP
ncbi:MAG: hypothetical protein P8I31_06465 [Bacteroidia bacterium]|nr:hypothetical protein [Bacteroidia bacterium]